MASTTSPVGEDGHHSDRETPFRVVKKNDGRYAGGARGGSSRRAAVRVGRTRVTVGIATAFWATMIREARTPAALNDCIQWQSTQCVGRSRVWAAPTACASGPWPAMKTGESSSPQTRPCAVVDRVPSAVKDQRATIAHVPARARNHFSISDQDYAHRVFFANCAHLPAMAGPDPGIIQASRPQIRLRAARDRGHVEAARAVGARG